MPSRSTCRKKRPCGTALPHSVVCPCPQLPCATTPRRWCFTTTGPSTHPCPPAPARAWRASPRPCARSSPETTCPPRSVRGVLVQLPVLLCCLSWCCRCFLTWLTRAAPPQVRVPNLPAFAPTELQEPGKKTFEEVYAALLPPADLPEQYKLAPSDCPVMLCKASGAQLACSMLRAAAVPLLSSACVF